MAATTSNRRSPAPTTTTRETKDGRRIEYQLSVIQQPERARACGSGAKCTSCLAASTIATNNVYSVCRPKTRGSTTRR